MQLSLLMFLLFKKWKSFWPVQFNTSSSFIMFFLHFIVLIFFLLNCLLLLSQYFFFNYILLLFYLTCFFCFHVMNGLTNWISIFLLSFSDFITFCLHSLKKFIIILSIVRFLKKIIKKIITINIKSSFLFLPYKTILVLD